MKFISELSGNHLGSIERAFDIVEAAADAGATHFKLQTFSPEQMVGDRNYVIPDGPWAGRTLYSLYQDTVTPRDWHRGLFCAAWAHGMKAMSTPFHPDDVEFLESIDCEEYKISSLETGYTDLLRAVRATGKHVYVSTGAITTDQMLKLQDFFQGQATYLKCTSAYPADPKDANLLTMVWLSQGKYEVGLSDHTLGIGVAVAAAALGASVIEKHITLRRSDGGHDAAFSMEPDEFRQMVRECRTAREAMGDDCLVDAEKPAHALRRGLWWARDLPAGHTVTREDVLVARPAGWLDPRHLDSVVGSRLLRPVMGGTPCR